MNTIPGLRSMAFIANAIAITSSAALQSLGLLSPIAANQKQKIRYWIPFTVGATGGVRCQVVVPAGGTAFVASIKLFNTVAPSLTTATQTASAAFTNALANAGTHWLEIEVIVTNGATAGSVDLQAAQNTSDVLTLTVLAGGCAEVIKYN
jgi:hypothetical protein